MGTTGVNANNMCVLLAVVEVMYNISDLLKLVVSGTSCPLLKIEKI
jgi:hypothetical protein